MSASVSVIVRCKNSARTIEATFESIRRQTLPSELVVVDSGSTDGTLGIVRRWTDVVVQMPAERFSFGRSLNLGAAAAHGSIHAAVSAHVVLPREDWLARLADLLTSGGVAGACGTEFLPSGRVLLEPYLQSLQDWVPGWGFSNTAAGWRAEVWRDHRFDEAMTASEDKEWALRVLQDGWTLAFDPLLIVSAAHRRRAGLRDLLRRSRLETRELVLRTGMPPVSARGAARTWWRDVVHDERTPPMLQRLNYFRLTEIVGSYLGSREAIRASGQYGSAPNRGTRRSRAAS